MFFLTTIGVLLGSMASAQTPKITAVADPPTARTATEPKKPGAEGAPIRLTILHRSSEELKLICGPQNVGDCLDASHWQIDLSGTKIAHKEWNKVAFEKLASEAKKSKGKGAAEAAPSPRSLEITADRRAPYQLVSEVLEIAAEAKIWKVTFIVKPVLGDTKKRLGVAVELPVDVGITESAPSESQPTDAREIRCVLKLDARTRQVRFLIDSSIGALDEAGVKLLEGVLGSAVTESKTHGKPLPILILQSWPDVAWQDVVKLMDAARAVGLTSIQFGRPPRSAAESRTSARISRKLAYVKNPTSTKEAEASQKVAMAGLDWLKRHQQEDGSWDASRVKNMCAARTEPTCVDGSGAFVAGTTAMAVLAFYSSAYDADRPSPFRKSIAAGVKWLIDHQDADGCIGPREDPRFTYSQAFAILALCEVVDADTSGRAKRALERAVAFAISCQNPGRGWRYGIQPGDNDTSITAWMIQGLATARDLGIRADPKSIRSGLDFLRTMTDEKSGRTGYVQTGSPVVRPIDGRERWPAELSEALTANALMSRIVARDLTRIDRHAELGFKLLAATPPVWDEAKGSIDYDYWYCGLAALRQWGGKDYDLWRTQLFEIAATRQSKDSCRRGSFAAVDPWSEEGGSIYATAMMVLALNVPYSHAVMLD